MKETTDYFDDFATAEPLQGKL